MAVSAGRIIGRMRPNVFWAPSGIAPPSIERKYSNPPQPMPTGWVELVDLASGAEVIARNPRVGIFSDKRGRIDSVPESAGGGGGGGGRRRGGGGGGGGRRGGGGGGGRGTAGQGHGASIGFEAETFKADFWKLTNKYSKNVIAAQAKTTEFKFATGATTNGTLVFTTSDGLLTFSVPVTSATQSTPATVATAVGGATDPTGYTVVVKSGATDTVEFTSSTTGYKPNWTMAAGGTGVTLSPTWPKVTTVGHPGFNSNYIDKDKEFNWQVFVEGLSPAGHLFDVDTHIMIWCPRVENTEDGRDQWAHDGEQAVIKAEVALETLPADPDELTTQIDGTGLTLAMLDPYYRFMVLDKPNA